MTEVGVCGYSFLPTFSMAQMRKAQHFRFLATLGMTEIRDKIIAKNPFYLPPSARERERGRTARLPTLLCQRSVGERLPKPERPFTKVVMC